LYFGQPSAAFQPTIPGIATVNRRQAISLWAVLALLWRLGRKSPATALTCLLLGGGGYAYEVLYARPGMAYLGLPEARWEQPLTWTRVFRNHGYMAGYSELRGDPLWVVYALSPAPEDAPRLKRPGRFSADWRSLSHVGHDDYDRSHYDRGHLAPNHAISVLYGREGQLDTFLMTNIVPQTAELNERVWERLEEAELDRLAPRFGKLWVVTGPVFEGGVERLKSSFRVEVPDACYKIYALPRPPGEAPKLLAFVIPQKVKGGEPLDRFLTSVDEVERLTGLDFFPELDPRLEPGAEGTVDPEFWGVKEWAGLAGRYSGRKGGKPAP
jgi:endonuclease G